jgi:hypothetical protein
MSEWWTDFDYDDPIRQGDILQRNPEATAEPDWALVVTADCDIVQRKAGGRYTCLSILAAPHWLSRHWAPDQLDRVIRRQVGPAAESLSGQLRQRDPDLDPLSDESLLRWLASQDALTICAAACPDRPPGDALLGKLTALRIAAGHEGPEEPLDRLRAAWTALGRTVPQQRAALREALEGERGFPDYFLLPDIPKASGYGHVVLLRDIASVQADEVFRSAVQARIADQPHAWHRVSRLGDGVRFAVVQKLAFLFSRIGLSSGYENACSAAVDLILEAVQGQDR